MSQRAGTNYSHVVGIDKPAGMTSHDVVNRVRRIYGERRVGHTGTLDPAATGAMMVCVGPAARLDRFLTGHNKAYKFTVVFGASTDTDDAEGAVVDTCYVPPRFSDEEFARETVRGMVGRINQLPPAYSAVRVNGKKAYDLARAGKQIDFKPRSVEVFSSELVGVELHNGEVAWRIAVRVSAGTYVRSLARDLGVSVGCLAHVGTLRRTSIGNIEGGECVSLEALEQRPFDYLVDPVPLLGYPVVFARDGYERDVMNGKPISADGLTLFAYDYRDVDHVLCMCSNGLHETNDTLTDGQFVSIIADNRLKAIYAYDAQSGLLRSECGFSVGVQRGATI